MNTVGIETLARLEAESKLLGRYRAAYDRIAAKEGHVEAVRTLVDKHRADYDGFVKDALARRRAKAQSVEPAA